MRCSNALKSEYFDSYVSREAKMSDDMPAAAETRKATDLLVQLVEVIVGLVLGRPNGGVLLEVLRRHRYCCVHRLTWRTRAECRKVEMVTT